MNKYTMIKILVKLGERATPTTFFQRIFGRSYFEALLKAAHNFGIPHAIYRTGRAGYFNGERLRYLQVEGDNSQIPAYVELFGSADSLQTFCQQNSELLRGHQVLFIDATELSKDSEMKNLIL